MKLKRASTKTGQKRIVSRADAIALMIASAAAALLTTAVTVSGIVALFTGPVTLVLPVATSHQVAAGLSLEATGHFTSWRRPSRFCLRDLRQAWHGLAG